MKSVKEWVVIDPDGEMIPPTLNWSKQIYSIESFIRNKFNFYDSTLIMKWKDYQKRGYRCIRVTLRTDE